MWNNAQLFLGIAIMAFGLLVNVARHNSGVKTMIERYILGVGDLFDKEAPYAQAVNFAGWKSFLAGLSIAVPLPIVWDTVLLTLAVLAIVWVYSRVRREYIKAKGEIAAEKATGTDASTA